MEISIIINHYQSPEMLKMALGYVGTWQRAFEKNLDDAAGSDMASEERSGIKTEIIVTDSGTSAKTRAVMEEYAPYVTFLQEKKNIGFGKSVNRALKRARGRYIFIMNADIVISQPEELNKLIDYLRQNKEVGMVGPRLVNFDESHQPSAFRYYTPLIIALRRTFLNRLPLGKKTLDKFTLRHHKNLLTAATPVDWIMGSAMLTKREHLERIGLFDERFFMYMEDVDLCRRFWEGGLKVMYYPLATLHHYHGGASRSQSILETLFNKYTRIHLVSAFKYFRKYGLKTPRYGV